MSIKYIIMKTIQYLTILFTIIFINCTQSQNINFLSNTEYNNIKVNGINWIQINDTQGNITEMKSLFGNDLIIQTDTEPSLIIDFWNNIKGFYFSFEDYSDTGTKYSLVDFEVTNSTSNITIKNTIITVGDNISILGNIHVNQSGKDVTYGTRFSEDTFTIEFDTTSHKITKISYNYIN